MNWFNKKNIEGQSWEVPTNECIQWVWRWWCNDTYPDSNARGANMGPIWGRQDPGGPHVGPMNIAIWVFTILPHEMNETAGGDDL